MLVSQILKAKGDRVFSAAPDETLGDVAGRLHDERVGALLVLEGETVVGVISERDVVTALARNAGAAMSVPVRDCMTADVVFAQPSETVDLLLARMTDRRVRHLPVVHEGRLCGVVSIGDLVKHKISEVEDEARTLKAYISAG